MLGLADTFVSGGGTKAEQGEFSYKSPGPEEWATASGSALARSQRQREREAKGDVVKGFPVARYNAAVGRGVIHASYLTVDKHS